MFTPELTDFFKFPFCPVTNPVHVDIRTDLGGQEC